MKNTIEDRSVISNLPVLLPIQILGRGLAVQRNGLLPYENHLRAALDWIESAHQVVEKGISKGFDLLRWRWAAAYPETTGYTIPTLLHAAERLGEERYRELALALADWLLAESAPEGGVAHWQLKQAPVVFDTGQVMFGWLAAYDATQDERYLQAASRAADWLVSIQDPQGVWLKNQHLGVAKTIDTRVAWALLVLHKRSGQNAWLEAARRNLEWAVGQQETMGWFYNCSFTPGGDTFTHTLVYTAEGLLECGLLLDEIRWIDAARLTADALLKNQQTDGRLASSYGPGWRATSKSSCLTGNCQAGLVWLQLYALTGIEDYARAAAKAIAFVARTQLVEPAPVQVRGAIAGSYPITGRYERLKYPNWAVKFFVDALLRLEKQDTFAQLYRFAG